MSREGSRRPRRDEAGGSVTCGCSGLALPTCSTPAARLGLNRTFVPRIKPYDNVPIYNVIEVEFQPVPNGVRMIVPLSAVHNADELHQPAHQAGQAV